MARVLVPALCAVVLTICQAIPVKKDKTNNVELRMPQVQPQKPDTYLCYSMKMGQTTYLEGFVPHANKSQAHHILLYGCKTPGETNKVWNCGEMASQKSEYEERPVCADGTKIIYAWAMDAPKLNLPEGVSFKVGPDSAVQWLVLQVHYKDVSAFIPPVNKKDNSGLTIKTSSTPTPYLAGVYLMLTGGEVAPKSTTYMEAACTMNQNIVLHPFAFRTHAHTHGRVVSGYRVREGEWTEIGRKDPRLPEMFYNVTHKNTTVMKNDILAARCTMVNDEKRPIPIGSTQHDEMCNFYMMYYTDNKQALDVDMCFSMGPPEWDWRSFQGQGLNLKSAPSTISTDPDTGKNYPLNVPNKNSDDVEEDNVEMDESIPEDGLSEDFINNLLRLEQQYEDENGQLYADEPWNDKNVLGDRYEEPDWSRFAEYYADADDQ